MLCLHLRTFKLKYYITIFYQKREKRKDMKNKILDIFVCTLLIVAVVLPVSGTVMIEKSTTPTSYVRDTLYVGGSGPNNYTIIQDALDNASDGDTVFVYDDSSPYYEHVLVNKAINLIGEDKNTTVINAGGGGDAVRITANWVNMSGFTTTGSGSGSYDGAIELNNVKYCHIENNKCINQYTCFYLYYATNNLIENNNCSSNLWYGFYTLYSHSNTMKKNTCLSNARSFYTYYSNNNLIDNNICSSNTEMGIFLSSNCEYNIISNNTCQNNTMDIIIGTACDNNIIKSNTILSNSIRGIYLYSHYNLIYNNYFENNPMHAYCGYGTNVWNITKTPGINIIGGAYLGGNYWDDYNGTDIDGDGLGDTYLPYNCFGNIVGGDWHPLVNIPPYSPVVVSPLNGATGVDINVNLSWKGGDPDPGNTVTYDIYLGDSSPPQYHGTTGPHPADPTYVVTYDPGPLQPLKTYYWKIIATDNHGASNYSPIWTFTTEEPNNPPGEPTITGPTSGTAGTSYTYKFKSIDPEGHDVWYYIDWGDESPPVDWLGPFTSGVEVPRSHTFENQGTYVIYAKAKDIYGLESDWGILEVTMPRNKVFNFNLLSWLFDRFPYTFPILRQILGLDLS